MGFNDIVLKALSDITGITVDLTTVCVGIIVIVVILCGLDFLKDVLLDRVSGGSEKSFDNPNFVKDNEKKYQEYARKKYWREQYKSRYESEYK